MKLSTRIGNIAESGTVKFTPIIAQLRKEGKDIIDFAVGEPNFETPKEIRNATKTALDNGKTHYSASSGLPILREKIAAKLESFNKLTYSPKDIIVSNGSKQLLYELFQVLLNPGDEVIIPTPHWTSYPEQVKGAQGKPVLIQGIDHQLDVDKIIESMNNKTKAIILNSPNNPTGAVLKKEDLRAVAETAVDNNTIIISDEAYETILYDGLKHKSIATYSEEIKSHTVSAWTFSKSYSMTGYRLGYMTAPNDIAKAIARLQTHISGNPCTFAQFGAMEALNMNPDVFEKERQRFEKNRNLAYSLANKVFDCIKPQGAFYLFPHTNRPSSELSMKLLKTGVATIPGVAFAAENHLRISYTEKPERIKEGFERISKTLDF